MVMRFAGGIRFVIGCFAVLVSAGVPAGDIAPGLLSEMDRLAPSDDVGIVVRYKDPLDLASFRNTAFPIRRETMLRALRIKAAAEERQTRTLRSGASAGRQLWLINAWSARVPAAAVRRIAAHTRVASVELDREIRLSATPAACGASPAGWNIDAVRAQDLWALGYNGAGVVVATMDSGADLHHPDLAPNWRGGLNSWFDPNGEHLAPADTDGHGTAALGLIVGGGAGGTAIGMAPGAKWMAVKIFNDAGTASLSDIHAGFQWLLDPDGNPTTDDAPDIVNNSWVLDGTIDECDDEFQVDIEALGLADIAVVFAAGNSGPGAGTSMSPANDPQSIAVGSVAEAFDAYYVASGSARGPSACGGGVSPRLVAPGAGVVSADRTLGGVFPDSYTCVSGTSFAAPHVAGAIALLKNAMDAQGLNTGGMHRLATALERGATDMGEPGPDNDSGAGLLNVSAAHGWLLDNAPWTQMIQVNPYSGQYSGPGYSGPIMTPLFPTSGRSLTAARPCGNVVPCEASKAPHR